jgi:hypothetical protein
MATKKVTQGTRAPKKRVEKPVSEGIRAALIQVVPGDLNDGVRDLQSVFDDLIDAEMVGVGAEHDAIVFGALKRLCNVRNTLSLYAAKAVAS